MFSAGLRAALHHVMVRVSFITKKKKKKRETSLLLARGVKQDWVPGLDRNHSLGIELFFCFCFGWFGFFFFFSCLGFFSIY